MIIQVLGTGCSKCKTLYEIANKAAEETGVDVEVEKVEDIQQIMAFQILMTPGLVINGNGEGRRSHPERGRGQEDDPAAKAA